MDSSVSPKGENWFLRVCHYISNAVYFLPTRIRSPDRPRFSLYNIQNCYCKFRHAMLPLAPLRDHRAPHIQSVYSVINSSLDRPGQLSFLMLSYPRTYLPSLYRPSRYLPFYRRFKTINRSINPIQDLCVKSSSFGMIY